jgi:V/A-type H+-transporting ATPase subunit C
VTEGFDFGNTRVRARRADLFGAARYQELVALDVDRLLAALSDTPYRPDLEAATPRHRGLRLLEEALRTNLARALREVVSWYGGPAGADIAIAVGRWDLRNVRAILRGQYARREPDEIRAALVPAGHLSDAVLGELAAQAGLRPTVELMFTWGVPNPDVARTAAAALPDFESSGDFQALERAVERAAAAQLRRALEEAGPEVARLLRSEIDQINVLTALRLQQAASESGEWDAVDPMERLLGGGALPLPALAKAAGADDPTAAAEVIVAAGVPAPWDAALQRWAVSTDLVVLNDDLDEAAARGAAAMFATADPLGPGVPLAYVWSKENEVKNLRTIGAGAAAGLPADQIEEGLVILW